MAAAFSNRTACCGSASTRTAVVYVAIARKDIPTMAKPGAQVSMASRLFVVMMAIAELQGCYVRKMLTSNDAPNRDSQYVFGSLCGKLYRAILCWFNHRRGRECGLQTWLCWWWNYHMPKQRQTDKRTLYRYGAYVALEFRVFVCVYVCVHAYAFLCVLGVGKQYDCERWELNN